MVVQIYWQIGNNQIDILWPIHIIISIYSMLHVPQSQKTQQMQDFMLILDKIKNGSSYKFMYSDIDSFMVKTNKILDKDIRRPKLTLRTSDHNSIVQELKINFTKLIDDINMLELHNLAICIQYVFDKLLTCLQNYFNSLTNCVNTLNQEIQLNQNRYMFLSKCSDCQKNFNKSKIENMLDSMTLAQSKAGFIQIAKIQKNIDELETNHNSTELSELIQELLQRKDLILGKRSQKISNIYDQIAQYLQSIPQSTISLSKENPNKPHPEIQMINIYEEFDKNFEDMLKHPIKKLIKRIIDYAKALYCKHKDSTTVQTQTLLIKDEQNIKLLLKSNEDLKKQLTHLKKLKRQTQANVVRMLDAQQKHEIQISQIQTQNQFLQQKLGTALIQLDSVKFKLEATEINRKQMSEKLVKDYTVQRSSFLRSIRELQMKIQSTEYELMRLRKQTQGRMISISIETQSLQLKENQTQTYQTEEDQRFYANSQIRKNQITRFVNTSYRKSGGIVAFGLGDDEDGVFQDVSYSKNKQKQNNTDLQRKKLTKPINNSYKSSRKIIINQKSAKQQLRTVKKTVKKKMSIQQNQLLPLGQQIEQKIVEFLQVPTTIQRKQHKKYSQKYKFSGFEDCKQIPKSHKSQLNLGIGMQRKSALNKKIKQRQNQSSWKDSEMKKTLQSSHSIRSKAKLDSSRMFLSRPHCSPYIGSATPQYTPHTWMQLLQVNTLKKQSAIKIEQQKQNENIEKIKFVQKIMQQYSKLKQSGWLIKINEIVSINESERQYDSQLVEEGKHINKSLPNSQNTSQTLIKQEQEKSKKQSYKLSQRPYEINLLDQSYLPTNQKQPAKDCVVFTKEMVILLFISQQYVLKYEQSVGIWSEIENSIMLDNNFMIICNTIQLFLQNMFNTQKKIYSQLSNFIIKPSKYLKKVNLKKQNALSRQGFRKKGHERNLSTNTIYNYQLNSRIQSSNMTPHNLRNIFHNILRFHKVIHKKCNHVEEFFIRLGMKQNNLH